ncbi:MAG TPA: hypothetical protein DDW68_01295 [Verrucomicrobiales bacterium]|nr:hypothetical protein [Verrucomicrobiales bacterium]HBE95790.1 hypothetical protein [Verrucomicrobiales bacterium]
MARHSQPGKKFGYLVVKRIRLHSHKFKERLIRIRKAQLFIAKYSSVQYQTPAAHHFCPSKKFADPFIHAS